MSLTQNDYRCIRQSHSHVDAFLIVSLFNMCWGCTINNGLNLKNSPAYIFAKCAFKHFKHDLDIIKCASRHSLFKIYQSSKVYMQYKDYNEKDSV